MTRKKTGGRGRQPESLLGTNLWRDPRTGVYYYRRQDPRTGKRKRITLRTKSFEIALRAAAQHEERFEREQAGLQSLDGWARDLEPLVDEFVASLRREGAAGEITLAGKRMCLLRALRELGLRTAADLNSVARVHDALLALEAEQDLSRVRLRRRYQDPLRQFSAWLAGNNRYLERDPLATWEPLRAPGRVRAERRASLPLEVARAFLSLDVLDRIHGRKHPSRLVFLLLLVAGPRAGALVSRDVEHFKPDELRIDFGGDVGKKRKGAGMLDEATCADLESYLGDRRSGPLVLSPRGTRLVARRLLEVWREAFAMALTDELWPAEIAGTVDDLYLVSQALLRGKPRGHAGNPHLVLDETREGWRVEQERIVGIAEGMRDAWTERMEGVDVHALRKTHRTWAQARQVPEVLIDKQLGHVANRQGESFEVLRVLSGSETGRKHYLDLRSRMLEAAQSAQAVRELLDEALGQLARGEVPSRLVTPPELRSQAGA